MTSFSSLLTEVRACTICEADLPLGPRPVLQLHPKSKVLIAGQAPGTKVHASGFPFDDASGNRLREWMGVTREVFYDPQQIAILPMGFCYPGTGKAGDLPPRPEWAPSPRYFGHLVGGHPLPGSAARVAAVEASGVYGRPVRPAPEAPRVE